MAKLKGDDELFELLAPILRDYKPISGDNTNETLINKLTRHPELEEPAKHAAKYYDFIFEKNPEKALRAYLFGLKEEAMQLDIAAIYDELKNNPKLKDKILNLVQQGMDPDIRDSPNQPEISVKDIFDESLFHERTDRWVTGKDGKEYLRATSMETRRNELIRQLSDLPYPELPGKVEELRKQYLDISGEQEYTVPATTYKREYVTLRQKTGKLVAEKGGIVDSIKRLDPAYDYRRIADKVGKLQDGNLSKEQQEFLDRQVRYLENDSGILVSYQRLVEKLDTDIKAPPKSLSVKDKILYYRRQLGDRLQEISGNGNISKKSLAYLDLVESQKEKNQQLYKQTVDELAKDKRIGLLRAKRWSDSQKQLPSWFHTARYIKKKQEEKRLKLFSDSTTFEDFQKAWEDPKNRNAVIWKEAKDKDGNPVLRKKDGKPVMIPEGVTKFGDKYYRTGIDDKILADAKKNITEEMFSASTSLEDFRKLWKKREYRSLIPWVQATDKNGALVNRSDGSPLMVPEGVTRFEGNVFRTDTDSEALAAAKRERTARLKDVTRTELEHDSWEDFNKKIQGKDPKYRSSWYWKEETDADGKVTKRYLDKLVSFGGNRYRVGIDDKRLVDDFARAVGEAPSIAEAAKQRILAVKQGQIDQLTADIAVARTAGKDVSGLEGALERKREQLAKLESRDYSYSHIGSLDRRADFIKEAADRLPVKADILELDPTFQFHKDLGDLSEIKRKLLSTKDTVKEHQNRLKREGLTAPNWVDRRPLDEQLSWYRTAETLMEDIDSKSYDEFRTAVDAVEFKRLNRNLPVGYLRRIKGNVYRSTVDADIISSYDNVAQRYREREQRAISGPAARAQPSVGQNKFGALLQQSMVMDQKIVQDAQAAFNSTSDLFSSSYGNLSVDAKRFYDRNYGVPVKEGNNYYRSIYDMPDDAWARAEKAAGYDTPRQRNGITSSDINTAEEEKLQQEVTADLKGRTWEPVKKEDKAVAAAVQEKKLDEIVVSARAEQETKNNLRRMLQRAEKEVKRSSIGSMGLMGAFVLFNAAMTGTSREAEERRRRVEQERRIKKYGYDYQ